MFVGSTGDEAAPAALVTYELCNDGDDDNPITRWVYRHAGTLSG